MSSIWELEMADYKKSHPRFCLCTDRGFCAHEIADRMSYEAIWSVIDSLVFDIRSGIRIDQSLVLYARCLAEEALMNEPAKSMVRLAELLVGIEELADTQDFFEPYFSQINHPQNEFAYLNVQGRGADLGVPQAAPADLQQEVDLEKEDDLGSKESSRRWSSRKLTLCYCILIFSMYKLLSAHS